ncbi:MAG: TonB-dependent receptor [Flaviaesturariibacter sp.]|nr:TonB-dependent receptor [Flaviaesturariibacter sp.]
MLKMRLLPLLLCAGLVSQAQQKPQKDTAVRRDSAVMEELKESVLDNIPTISLDENDMGDAGTQNISSVLTAGRDPFFSAASFNFSAVRFRIRGYDNDYFGTYMNGVPMDNLDNGFTPYGLWGGLNDVMRNRDVSYGLHYNTFAFGDIGSNTNIDSRASKQRAQTSFSYANANRNYTHRWMISHSTGLSKKGWAFSGSVSRRWAEEGYVPGTYYNGWSYFAGVDKRIGQKHLLSLVAFGAPTENGRQGATTKEMMDLAGKEVSDNDPNTRSFESDHYYNPNWGYQNGVKRNASIGRTNQPVILLTHDFRIKNNMTLTTGAGFSFGDRSVTALDWYNAPDPRPDYYRYLPSYTGQYSSNPDPVQAQQISDLLHSDVNARQINWQRLYDVNRASFATIQNANGIQGNSVSGRRSRYIVEERVVNTKRLNLNSVLNTRIGNNIDFTAGVSYQRQNNHYFKRVDDLLGGDFYVNVNQFAERDFPTDTAANQNDIDHPNRILTAGDEFGYDYNINLDQAATWAQGVFKFNKVDFFAAAQYSHTNFQRVGNVRNGLYKDLSFGKSKMNSFDNYAVKGGVTYKFNGRHYVYANGSYMTKAPYFENVYISPRTRNTQQDNVKSEEIYSAEGGYVMNAPKLKLRIGGFYTHFDNQLEVMSFYHDGFQNLVNYAINGISKLHFGGEFGAEMKLTTTLTLNAAAAVGRYYYDSKQQATITVDNSTAVLGEQIIYAQNFRVPSTPQEAYSLGLTYRSPKFWFVSLTGNYFDQNYLSMNPLRRTYDALKGVDPKSEDYNRIFDQTKFPGTYTLDFFGGYSWKLPRAFNINHRSTFLMFNVGVSNLTNNQNIQTGGYEQLRFDASTGIDNRVNVDKFPPKLFYAYGLNYFASATIRF